MQKHKDSMSSILIKNATIINEGRSFRSDLLIKDELITSIGSADQMIIPSGTKIIDATGLLLIPGVIDDQVHFREPGLTHKGDIYQRIEGCSCWWCDLFYGYAKYQSTNSYNRHPQ